MEEPQLLHAFPDGTGKFFDEMSQPRVGEPSDKTKYQTFCLDDIVLTVADSQDVQDKDSADASKALADKSRVAQLYLNPDNATDKFKMELWEAANEGYFSKKGFAKDAAGKYRNVIVEYSPHTRAVVFCSGFHDVFDKRTVSAGADFGKKHVRRRRAARLNDADVSFREDIVATSNWDVYTAKDCGNFAFHLLQYGAVDFTNNVMYCAGDLLELPARAGAGVTAGQVGNHRDDGMKNSMQRWNVKNYEVRLTNRTTLKGKTFCLFEAKLDNYGGKHISRRRSREGRWGRRVVDGQGHFPPAGQRLRPGAGAVPGCDHRGHRRGALRLPGRRPRDRARQRTARRDTSTIWTTTPAWSGTSSTTPACLTCPTTDP